MAKYIALKKILMGITANITKLAFPLKYLEKVVHSYERITSCQKLMT